MKSFITNQKKLAKAAGVTQQHLSAVKRARYAVSDELANTLASITDIPSITWISPSRNKILCTALKAFFQKEKASERLSQTTCH